MILLDTHTWLWWIAGERSLSGSAVTAIEDAVSIGIPTVACMEVVALARRNRIDLAEDVQLWIAKALAQDRVEEVPMTSRIAIRAGSYGEDFVGDPADRIIYASAVETGRRLVTRDRFLRRYDPGRTLW